MSRLSRLSARAYGRLSNEQKNAVDVLQWGNPDAARRGEAKTILRWRRTREETIAYAERLLATGLMRPVVADRLRVDDDYLRRLLDPSKSGSRSRRPSEETRTNRQRQGVRSSLRDGARPESAGAAS